MTEQQQKQPFFSGLLPKILIIVAIGLVIWVFISGFQFTLPDLLSKAFILIIAVVLIVLVAKGVQSLIKKPEFSPTRRWKEKLERVAELSKPFNVRNLYIRGEDMRVYSKWGKITGLAFVPYLAGKPKVDSLGNYIYVDKIDKNGNIIKNKKTGLPEKVHQYEYLVEKDGEWCFVVKRGFWIFATKEVIRAKKELVSDIGEIVWIKAPNLIPIGDYFYPSQQWQTDIHRIQMQHQSEALVETYQEFLDLVANITTMTLRADPHFRKIQEANVETIQSTPQQGAGQ